MRVKEIMTTPAVTILPTAQLKYAAQLLLKLKLGALPVADQRGRLVGIVSEADLVQLEATPDRRSSLLARLAHGPERTPRLVREVMTPEVEALGEDADIADAARLMLKKGHRSIPVLADDHVAGIVARRDLLKVIARTDSDIRAELEELLEDELGIIDHYTVDITDGVATLTGPADPVSRSLPGILARTVPGVLEVRFTQTTGA